MNDKKKKKTGAGGWVGLALAILLVNLIEQVDERSLRLFFLRLRHSPVLVIAIVAIVISVVIALTALAANKRLNAEKSPRSTSTGNAADRPVRRAVSTGAQHSHDRIQGYTTGSEDGYTHWKKQLDGFLAAGIIDRKEYQALLERRKDSYPG